MDGSEEPRGVVSLPHEIERAPATAREAARHAPVVQTATGDDPFPALLASLQNALTDAQAQQLRGFVDRLRGSEQRAQQDFSLLKEVIDLLPIGVTLQDQHGGVVLASAAADPAMRADLPIASAETEQTVAG